MKAAIEKIKEISKEIGAGCYDKLEGINLHKIFSPVFKMNITLVEQDALICFIILAYDNDSGWLNLKQDRHENKLRILKSLTTKYEEGLFTDVINNSNDKINDVIAEYLISQCTWQWNQIMMSLDFHSNTLKFISQKTETEKSIDKVVGKGENQEVKTLVTEFDIDVVAKVTKQKGDLLEQALKARRSADELLTEIKRDFVQLDNAVQADFNFSITDERKINPESWRDYIKERNKKK
jgi:hypothetical protein